MTRFEEELHRAAEQRSTTATAVDQSLQRFREHNAPARQEAARRLVQVAEDVRSFLMHHRIPPRQIIAVRTTRLRGRHLVHVASGWSLMPYFVTVEGRFVRFVTLSRAEQPYGEWRPKTKPGQHYIGHIGKAVNPVKEVQDGVHGAIFASKAKPMESWYRTGAEFADYYYTDLSGLGGSPKSQGIPCPGEALLLTPGTDELWMARHDFHDDIVSVVRRDKEIADSALKLVESAHG